MKSWKTPTPQQIEKAIALLVHPQQRNYFFNRLQNPKWITLLKKKGFFQHPPEVIQDPSQGTVSFPVWAESRYLARIAQYEPETVLKIALEIETDNPSIHHDFVDAALQMPPQEAVKLVPKVKDWLESPYSSLYLLLSEEVAALMVHLAKGDKVKKALELARTLLAVMPDPSINSEEGSENRVYRPLPQPRVRIGIWEYEEILKKYVPKLVELAGEKALIALGFLLNDAVKLSLHSHEDREEQQNDSLIWEDYSRIWRYAIEDHPRNHCPNEVRELLVVAVRDAAEQIVKQDPAKMRSLVLRLEKWPWRIFHRIALYLIRKFPADRNLLFERLVDQKRFTDGSSYEDYEYAFLLKEYFARLPGKEQEKILGWIENPELDLPWREEQEEKAHWIRHWQLNKLTPLKDNLPAQWQQRYNQLVNEFGAVELSEVVSGGVGKLRVLGDTSPKSDLELDSMSIEELVSFLKIWQPNSRDRFDGPSREGLGDALARLAEKSPERYALAAEHFQGLHAIYIRNLLWGLHKALNNQKQQGELREFSWSSVLSLCRRIVEDSEQIQERQTTDSDRDLYWREAYQRVADLLGVGLTADQSGIPFNLREEVWNALRPLTQHPDPTPEYETRYGGSNMNPSELSINTVRGEAMHTVVRYALWIRRHFEQAADGAKHLERGFDEMPEVQQVLNTRLDPEQETSLAIRSVYGRWFPWLVLLDRHWATQNVVKIFPQDETLSDLRRAAWEGYILFCPVYDNVFDVLHEEYSHAVELINAASSDQRSIAELNHRLAQHLMTLCWRGKLNLDQPGGLLRRFFDLAPDALRGYTLEFVGRSLRDTQDAIDPEILNRLQLLWEHRLEAANTAISPTSHATELAAFGWWFASGKFNDSWAIAQLKQVFELVDKVDADFLVVKRLAVLADVMLESVVECLRLMIEKDENVRGIYRWRDEPKTILVAAIKGSNDVARQTAETLIHYLGESGYWDFRELLAVGRNNMNCTREDIVKLS